MGIFKICWRGYVSFCWWRSQHVGFCSKYSTLTVGSHILWTGSVLIWGIQYQLSWQCCHTAKLLCVGCTQL